MKFTPAHIIGGFIGAAALTGSATIAAGLSGKNGDVSPLIFVPMAVGITGVTAGIHFGAKVAAYDAMKGAAIFATGLGAGVGALYTLPLAVGMASNKQEIA